MDIRSGLDGLKTLLGVTPAAQASVQREKTGQIADGTSLTSDRATLSSAGSEVAQTAADGGVRTYKGAEVQSALTAGTYQVPASAVAAKMVDAMLGRGQ
jgi:anti-sigma28 factor (negative regulator of flagellin synthesis)